MSSPREQPGKWGIYAQQMGVVSTYMPTKCIEILIHMILSYTKQL